MKALNIHRNFKMMSSNTLKLCHHYYCEQFVIKILNILQSE